MLPPVSLLGCLPVIALRHQIYRLLGLNRVLLAMRCLLLLRLVHHLLRVLLPLRGAQLALIRLPSMCCTLFDGRIGIGLQGRFVVAVGQFAQGFARLLIALVNLL